MNLKLTSGLLFCDFIISGLVRVLLLFRLATFRDFHRHWDVEELVSTGRLRVIYLGGEDTLFLSSEEATEMRTKKEQK